MAKKEEVSVNLRIERDLHDEVIREVAQYMAENPSIRYTKSNFIRDSIRFFLNERRRQKQKAATLRKAKSPPELERS